MARVEAKEGKSPEKATFRLRVDRPCVDGVLDLIELYVGMESGVMT